MCFFRFSFSEIDQSLRGLRGRLLRGVDRCGLGEGKWFNWERSLMGIRVLASCVGFMNSTVIAVLMSDDQWQSCHSLAIQIIMSRKMCPNNLQGINMVLISSSQC